MLSDSDVFHCTFKENILLCNDTYCLLGSLPLSTIPIQLTGFNSKIVMPLGSFQTNIEVDNNTFSTNAHVISFSHMSLPIIIGTDILQGTLTCETGASFSKSNSTNIFIHLINTCDDYLNMDLRIFTTRVAVMESTFLSSSTT